MTSLKRVREEQPQEQASSSSSLALTTTHQDEAAILQALVASSLFNGLPTVVLFLIMGFVDCVDGGLSRIISLSSSMHRDVNNLLERLSNQASFAITTSGRCCCCECCPSVEMDTILIWPGQCRCGVGGRCPRGGRDT